LGGGEAAATVAVALAMALGGLHSRALAHKDAQVKNIAHDNQGVRIVDLTDMRRMDEKNARPDVVGDIGEYTTSLNHVDDADGHGSGSFTRDYTDTFIRTFVPTYTSIVNSAQSELPQAARLSPQDIEAIARAAA
jgi:tRNA A-37 threonylcarbamoyl transferase component Bud32